MSHEATNWALKQRGLKPATRIVLFCLADRHNPDFGCFPNHKTLAEDAEMSERSVRTHLGFLEEMGLIHRESGGRVHGEFASTRYILAFENDGGNQRQNLPPEKSASGKKRTSPAAKSAVNQRQNLPTNPVRDNPVREPSKTLADAFAEFWAICPRKKGKGAAEKAFSKAVKNAGADAVIAGMERHAREVEGKDPQYIPHPSTWLNESRWEDAPEPAKETRSGSEVARRVGDRFKARGVDRWQDSGAVVPLLPARNFG